MTAGPQPGLLEVGRVARAHGLRGEVVVALITDRAERLDPGSTLRTAAGELTVQASRPHGKGWIVAFEGVADRDGADALRGTVLLAPPLDDPDVLWVHDLVGAEVVLVATGEPVGRCVGLQANPAADLLVLDGGELVPLTFVVDHEPGRVVIDPPEGLLDL